jgi:hypothetical protein
MKLNILSDLHLSAGGLDRPRNDADRFLGSTLWTDFELFGVGPEREVALAAHAPRHRERGAPTPHRMTKSRKHAHRPLRPHDTRHPKLAHRWRAGRTRRRR